MLFFISIKGSVRIVPAKSLECLKERYPDCLVYCYRDSGNPVTVSNDDSGLHRANKHVLANMSKNKYCHFQ